MVASINTALLSFYSGVCNRPDGTPRRIADRPMCQVWSSEDGRSRANRENVAREATTLEVASNRSRRQVIYKTDPHRGFSGAIRPHSFLPTIRSLSNRKPRFIFSFVLHRLCICCVPVLHRPSLNRCVAGAPNRNTRTQLSESTSLRRILAAAAVGRDAAPDRRVDVGAGRLSAVRAPAPAPVPFRDRLHHHLPRGTQRRRRRRRATDDCVRRLCLGLRLRHHRRLRRHRRHRHQRQLQLQLLPRDHRCLGPDGDMSQHVSMIRIEIVT